MSNDNYERSEDSLNQNTTQANTASDRLSEEAQVESAKQLLDWGKTNFGRFDLSGDRRLNMSELHNGLRTADNQVDHEMLAQITEQYGQLKHQNRGLFGHKDSISISDLEKNVRVQEHNARKAEEARAAQERLQQQQSASRDLMQPLLQTGNGDEQRSLFKVLDDSKGNRADNKVAKSDLDRFMREYDRRAEHGDIGNGVYTAENRNYVEFLRKNWNREEVVRLRGTYRDSDGRQVANGTISLDSLQKAGGFASAGDAYASFATGEPVQDIRTASDDDITYGDAQPKFKRNVQRVTEDPDTASQREQQLAQLQKTHEMRNWAGNNFSRFDITGDRKWTHGEIDTGKRTAETIVDYDALDHYSGNFGKIARSNRTRISMEDINRHVRTESQMFEQAEQQRQERLAQRQAQAESFELVRPLLSTDNGFAEESLWSVIDGLKGSHDDKIGKGDLERYLHEFDRRARHHDIGTGHFTLSERQYVQYLVDNWNNSDVVALRGQFWSDQQQRYLPNKSMTLSRLREAANLPTDPYRAYRPETAEK